MTLSSHEFDTIASKLNMEIRDGDHRFAWLKVDGRIVIRTKRSHGRKPQPSHLIRNQLKVDEAQMQGLVQCWLTKDAYLEILKAKQII
jgi:hypothetical protein